MENITGQNVQLVRRDGETAIGDSPGSSGGIRNPLSAIPEGAKPSEVSDEPIPNGPSKTKNRKRPYVVTPRRRAAMLANLGKARATPKEKVYRPSEKHRAANQANLKKAHAARAAARVERQAFCDHPAPLPVLPVRQPVEHARGQRGWNGGD